MDINPKLDVIYVRDISENESELFSELKKKFKINSNSKMVRRLIIAYTELLKDYSTLQDMQRKSRLQIEELNEQLEAVYEFGELLNKLCKKPSD